MNLCNLCCSSELKLLIDFGLQPVAKHYLLNRTDAQPTWPVELYFCESCGLTQLANACPPELLYDNYVTLSAWKPQPHAQHEIDIIKKLPTLDVDAKIIEIGSNDGEFLIKLAENGFRNSLGVEPAKDAYEKAISKGMKTINSFLNAKSADVISQKHGQFDMLISRQNLEHMSDLQEVLQAMGKLVKPSGYVLIEVPNFGCNLDTKDYSLWEEHVNYFTIDTLQFFLSKGGLQIVHQEIFRFSGEGIFIVARKTDNVIPNLGYLSSLRNRNYQYSHDYPSFRASIENYLKKLQQNNKKIAIYGAGARVFCLINFLNLSAYIDVIVDDQIEKQDKYMPGGKTPITSSDALYARSIDVCLLGVNAENEDRVIAKHRKWVETGGEFWSVLPPSEKLIPIW